MASRLPQLAYGASTLGAGAAVYALSQVPGLRLDVAVFGVVTVVGVLIGLVERAAPFEARWNLPVGDSGVDVAHLLLSTVAVEVVFAAVAQRWAWGGSLWPTTWPLPLQVPLALIIAELGAYAVHRWMHGDNPLWRIHKVHHSARRLHSLNASRNHPLDTLSLLVCAGLPLLTLGVAPQVVAVTAAVAIAHLQFQHANTALELGPLNWLLAGPQLHRWHHSRVPQEANSNYGHVLIIWDVLFRTRRLPEGRPPADVGLFAGENLPENYFAQLRAPFR